MEGTTKLPLPEGIGCFDKYVRIDKKTEDFL